MGKRSKPSIIRSESIKSKNKKQKSKKKNKTQANDNDTGINNSVFVKNENVKAEEAEVAESITPSVNNKKVKSKNKNKGHLNHEDQETSKVIVEENVAANPEEILTTSSKKVKTKKRRKTPDDCESESNKKIKFTDDGSIEVTAQRKKNEALSQEDDVKDEDIDKFCDEINEEDNALYEDWVKLLEAKLNSNKKKPK